MKYHLFQILLVIALVGCKSPSVVGYKSAPDKNGAQDQLFLIDDSSFVLMLKCSPDKWYFRWNVSYGNYELHDSTLVLSSAFPTNNFLVQASEDYGEKDTLSSIIIKSDELESRTVNGGSVFLNGKVVQANCVNGEFNLNQPQFTLGDTIRYFDDFTGFSFTYVVIKDCNKIDFTVHSYEDFFTRKNCLTGLNEHVYSRFIVFEKDSFLLSNGRVSMLDKTLNCKQNIDCEVEVFKVDPSLKYRDLKEGGIKFPELQKKIKSKKW